MKAPTAPPPAAAMQWPTRGHSPPYPPLTRHTDTTHPSTPKSPSSVIVLNVPCHDEFHPCPAMLHHARTLHPRPEVCCRSTHSRPDCKSARHQDRASPSARVVYSVLRWRRGWCRRVLKRPTLPHSNTHTSARCERIAEFEGICEPVLVLLPLLFAAQKVSLGLW